MDNSRFVRSPASAPGAATDSPGALFSCHSTVDDSSSHHQARPAHSATGQESGGSEDAPDADGDHRDGDSDLYKRLLAFVTRESIPVTEAIHECIDNGVVLEYEYHKGSDKHGTVLKDLEYPDKVNAFAECDKFFRGGIWRNKGVWSKEDEFRWIQVYYLCLHHVLQEQMYTELEYSTCEALKAFFAFTIPATVERVLPDDSMPEPEVSTTADVRN